MTIKENTQYVTRSGLGPIDVTFDSDLYNEGGRYIWDYVVDGKDVCCDADGLVFTGDENDNDLVRIYTKPVTASVTRRRAENFEVPIPWSVDHEFGPWIIWNGGDSPVDVFTRVQVQRVMDSRLSAEEAVVGYASELNWGADNVPYAACITAYRILVEEPAPVTVTETYHYDYDCDDIFTHPHDDGEEDCRDFTVTVCGDEIKAEWV